jgi:hypothetical protein
LKKILVSVPDDLFLVIQKNMPKNHRSRIISNLIKESFDKEREALIQACIELNNNEELDKEMKEFRNSYPSFEGGLNDAW